MVARHASLLDVIGRGRADRRLRRRDGRRMGLPELHEKPHLVIGYMAAGHKVIQRQDTVREKVTANKSD